ncbi:MAG: hypothetical protein IPM39_27260 [Chloroflexi bacterium]|nr:hypothetical protein [Chloroflexota bacterium]
MKRLQQHWAKREQQRWETAVAWFRVRYREASGVGRSARLLSGPVAGGRVALRYQPGAVAQLWLGVPLLYAPLLWQMADDFGFVLHQETVPPAEPELLAAAADLPWERPFTAHIVDGSLFVSGEETGGAYLPSPNGVKQTDWRLPEPPPVGMGLAAAWQPAEPPADLLPTSGEGDSWLLGWNQAGQMLAGPGRVNLYGATAADWLVAGLTQTIAAGHGGLVILDGVGDLAPRLKRKPAVTRLLGRGAAEGDRLHYLDIDGAAVIDGFDPLAAVSGESESRRRARRRQWFRLMGVHRTGLTLLDEAPLGDLNGLQKWLAAPARQRRGAAAGSLEAAVGRLMADRQVRQWLEWPADRYGGLPQGALIFGCRGQEWARRQLLLAALLAACAVPGVRLVLHGLPWGELEELELERELEEELELERELEEEGEESEEDEEDDEDDEDDERGGGGRVGREMRRGRGWRRPVLLSNGPLLSGSLPVLTASEPEHTARLARRFLADDPVLTENLHLLPPGEGLVCHESGLHHTRW